MDKKDIFYPINVLAAARAKLGVAPDNDKMTRFSLEHFA